MLRTLNYTGRERILRKDVSIELRHGDGAALSFDADLRLATYNLPSDARVFVEAYRQTNWMRFDFGRASSPHAQSDCLLGQFDSPDGILFRVRVTSADGSGLLLGEADEVPLLSAQQTDEDKVCLLPVKPENLGHEIWRLDFSRDRPVLAVNRRVEDWRAFARSPIFVALALPGALRQVFIRILHVDKHNDTEDLDDWRSRWLSYATTVLNTTQPPDPSDQPGIIDDWIDSAVESFCRKFHIMDRFNRIRSLES
jgi:hypothetical protein